MASAVTVTQLGLIHVRPLQQWLPSRVSRWAWFRGTLRVTITHPCHRSFSPWMDLAFLRAGVPLEQVSQHVVVMTRCLQHGLGRYMQQVGSLGALDGTLTTSAHKLSRAAGSASSLAAVPATDVRQACVGLYGQL